MGEDLSEEGQLAVSSNLQGRLVLAVLGVAVSLAGVVALARSIQDNGYPLDQWNTTMAGVIHADNSQSVRLPDGQTLWVYGDTTQVNGHSVVSSGGYPHSSFVLQDKNNLKFEPVLGQYGAGWQQVPNWPDGSYFWMSAPVVDQGSLYVLGSRVMGMNPYTVKGAYVARFDLNSLQFQSITAVPDASGTIAWGSVAQGSGGWWVAGTHTVDCSFEADCHAGDFAWVPAGDLANSTAWRLYPSIIDAKTNVGSVVALVKAPGGWDVFTKSGDAYGGNTIEKLTAATVTGTWSNAGTWPATSPLGTFTYSVAVHPEQQAPASDVLVSYNVNAVASEYHARFVYLPR